MPETVDSDELSNYFCIPFKFLKYFVVFQKCNGITLPLNNNSLFVVEDKKLGEKVLKNTYTFDEMINILHEVIINSHECLIAIIKNGDKFDSYKILSNLYQTGLGMRTTFKSYELEPLKSKEFAASELNDDRWLSLSI